MVKITINLPGEWILSKRGQGALPIERIQRYLADHYAVSADTATFQTISFLIGDDVNRSELVENIARMLGESYSTDASSVAKLMEVSVSEGIQASGNEDKPRESADEPKEPAANSAAEKREVRRRPAFASRADDPGDSGGKDPQAVLEKIRGLVGCDSLRDLCEELHIMAPALRDKKLTHVATEQNYIFSIDSGYGSSTMADLFQEFMVAEGLLEESRYTKEHREFYVSVSEKLDEQVKALAQNRGNVVLLDITEWCDKLTDPAFRDFLGTLHKNDRNCVYIFKLPYLERTALSAVQDALSDVMRVKLLEFPPLSLDQLQQCAAAQLSEFGYSADPEAWELFGERIAQEKADGRFYGMNTVNNVVSEMLYLQVKAELSRQDVPKDVITGAALLGLTDQNHRSGQATAEELFGQLIGIEKLRDKIYEIVNQIEFARSSDKVNTPAMHMRFVGNPGTGKTTVARIVGLLLRERGILSKGGFFEHAGGDFIGMYVGHTVPKTLALCRDAYGSVLFIDEAYTLADADYNGGSGYAREAVDTLIAQMENHRDDLMVIMAGYPDEMQRLMALNPGLEGRMPYLLEFPNYNREELEKIFLLYVEQSSFELAEGVRADVHEYFSALPDVVIASKDFSNARFVRNLFENTWGKAVTRARMGEGSSAILTAADFAAACRETTPAGTARKNRRNSIGFHV